MLKRLWNNLVDTDEDTADAKPDAGLDRETLTMLTEHFAIGRKVRYYPEFQRDIVFHTIIIAYQVNGHLIYTRDAIHHDAEGLPTSFALGERRRALAAEQVKDLQLMVPDTTEMERSLDIVRRASLGRNGQFVRGNTITLMGPACQRGVPSLETQVDRRIKLKDGPYLDNQMILLRPEFATLCIADQRQKARLPSDMPANLYLKEGQPPVACVLADFSDVSLRLKARSAESALPAMKANDKVTVTLDFGDGDHAYRIRGLVFRAGADSCVLNLRQIYKDGEFVPIGTMDVLEIKTCLLNRRGPGSSTPRH